MKIVVWCLLALILSVTSAHAQVHPCDIPTDTAGKGSIVISKTYVLSWCQPAAEVGVTFKEYRNGVASSPLTPTSGTVSTSGYRQYFISNKMETTIGIITVELTAVGVDGQESAKSAPFTLTVMRPAPVAPTGLRVTQ